MDRFSVEIWLPKLEYTKDVFYEVLKLLDKTRYGKHFYEKCCVDFDYKNYYSLDWLLSEIESIPEGENLSFDIESEDGLYSFYMFYGANSSSIYVFLPDSMQIDELLDSEFYIGLYAIIPFTNANINLLTPALIQNFNTLRNFESIIKFKNEDLYNLWKKRYKTKYDSIFREKIIDKKNLPMRQTLLNQKLKLGASYAMVFTKEFEDLFNISIKSSNCTCIKQIGDFKFVQLFSNPHESLSDENLKILDFFRKENEFDRIEWENADEIYKRYL